MRLTEVKNEIDNLLEIARDTKSALGKDQGVISMIGRIATAAAEDISEMSTKLQTSERLLREAQAKIGKLEHKEANSTNKIKELEGRIDDLQNKKEPKLDTDAFKDMMNGGMFGGMGK